MNRLIVLMLATLFLILLAELAERRKEKVQEDLLVLMHLTTFYSQKLAGLIFTTLIMVFLSYNGLSILERLIWIIILVMALRMGLSFLPGFSEVIVDNNNIMCRNFFIFRNGFRFSEVVRAKYVKKGLEIYIKTKEDKEKRAFLVYEAADQDGVFLEKLIAANIPIDDGINKDGEKIDIIETYQKSKTVYGVVEELVEAINNKDAVMLKNLFSESAIAKVVDLDGQIANLLLFYNRGEITYFYYGPYENELNKDAINNEWLVGEYTLHARYGKYRMRCDYRIEKDQPEERGLCRLETGLSKFYKKKGKAKHCWQYTDKEPGIYIASFDE